MSKLVVANWKMNPATVGEAVALANAEDHEGLVICPPFPFLEAVGRTLHHATLGAQDAFIEAKGAFTGEVSPEELASLGVRYVILGHSERRKMGETDELIAKKVAAVASAGLTPILCVGEQRAEHNAGKAEEVVKRQLEIDLSLVGSSESFVVAYEPVWAISTEPGAKPDSPENAAAMSSIIRSVLLSVVSRKSFVVLYGGSVTAENAGAFLSRPEIDGALVGGASLKPEAIGVMMKVARAAVSR